MKKTKRLTLAYGCLGNIAGKEKTLVISIFYFSHNIITSSISLGPQNSSLCDNGIICKEFANRTKFRLKSDCGDWPIFIANCLAYIFTKQDSFVKLFEIKKTKDYKRITDLAFDFIALLNVLMHLQYYITTFAT